MKRISIILLAILVMASMVYPSAYASSKTARLNSSVITIEAGTTYTLKVSGASKVTYKSSNTKVAKVTSKGVVKGIKSGSCKVYATYKKGKTTKKLTCKVNVYIKPYLSKKTISLEKGKLKNIYVKGKNISSIKYSTKSSRVKVYNDGRIKGLSPGTAYVYATVKYKKTGSSKLSQIKLKLKVKVYEKTDLSAYVGFDEAYADFAASLFRNEYLSAGKNCNILLSPQSITNAMMMAAEGAAGNTYTQLDNAITGSVAFDTFRGGISGLNRNLSLSEKVKFKNANSVWIKDAKDEFIVEKDYLDILKKNYFAETYEEPFNSDTVKKINKWVSDNTDEQINEIISDIPKDAVMYLVNAICFEGKWQEQYSEPVKDKKGFKNSRGEYEAAKMLNGSVSYILKDSKATGFLKSYEGGDFAFAAILPDEGVSLSEYINGMTGASFLKLMNNPVKQNAVTKMPEFKYDYSTELSSSLNSLGITDAFNPDLADFTKMGTTDTGALSISRVIHKTHIELDRNGTKAAAATAVEMSKATSLPGSDTIEIFLDRPFIYAIIDTKTGVPVFIGTVNSIAGN